MKHLILGAVLLVLGLWGLQVWWNSFSFVIRAMLPLVLLAVGLAALLSSYFRAYAGGADDDEEEADEAEVAVEAVRANVQAQSDEGAEHSGAGPVVGPEPQES